MADDIVADIIGITGATPEIAAQYAQLADNDLNQAITLYYENGGADLSGQSATTTTAQPPPRAQTSTYEDASGVVHIDSDEDDAGQGGARATTFDADAEMARRLQEEMYGGRNQGEEEEDIRAPDARQAQTLVGPGAEDDGFPAIDDMPGAIQQRMQEFTNRRAGGRIHGIWNQQQPTSTSIWTAPQPDIDAPRPEAAGGTTEYERKSNLLAELFRPPFSLMYSGSWDSARDEGKEDKKWILVNIQDPSIFDCQVLNRDIWKNEGVVETVKEHFIFMQYTKDDPRASQYLQYYFQNHDSQDAYPHIAIVDPRTGEQVKTWSGPPVPKAADFLMQLHEFLDRYSLRSDAKMPVARRKPDVKKEHKISQMSEEEQLEMALQASMAGQPGGARDVDPDDLTRSIPDLGKGKQKASEVIDLSDDEMYDDPEESTNGTAEPEPIATKPFDAISASNPHAEPEQSPQTTRIAFRHPSGRVIRKFLLSDSVRRIYEWLKAEPLEGKAGQEFDLIFSGKNLIESLDETIENAGLKNGTVMIEFTEAE